jgi:hypothetical protein
LQKQLYGFVRLMFVREWSPKQEMMCFNFTFWGYTAASDLRHDVRIEPATG